VPDLRAGINDQERAAALLQLPSDRQSGLAGTDHKHIEDRVLGLRKVAAVGRHYELLERGVDDLS